MQDPYGEVSNVRSGSRVLPFLLVVGTCLAAGIWLGSLAGGGWNSAERAGEASESFTFLGYDDLLAPTRLTAIWVLELDGRGNARYLGISPATIILAKDGQAAVLRELLADPRSAPAKLYQVERIQNPSTAVAFDNHALAMIINRMGGIRIDGRPLRGQDAVALAASESDPLDQLRLQSRIVAALFGVNGPCLGEAAYAGLEPEHLISTKPADVFVADCIQRGPYVENSIQVDILDLVEKIDLPDGNTGLWPKTP